MVTSSGEMHVLQTHKPHAGTAAAAAGEARCCALSISTLNICPVINISIHMAVIPAPIERGECCSCQDSENE